jgi:hypothetical protein
MASPVPLLLLQYGDALPKGWEDHILKAVHALEEKGELKHGGGHHTGHYLLTAAALKAAEHQHK